MKRLLISLGILTLIGAGCFGGGEPQEPNPEMLNSSTYLNEEFSFQFDYPQEMEVRVRPDDVRAYQYVGRDVDFFASLRDIVRDAEPANIAYFYAAEGMDADGFISALEESADGVELLSREDMKVNDLDLVKTVNATALGTEKVHYLLQREDKLIIISVFLAEETAFDPVLQTMNGYEK